VVLSFRSWIYPFINHCLITALIYRGMKESHEMQVIPRYCENYASPLVIAVGVLCGLPQIISVCLNGVSRFKRSLMRFTYIGLMPLNNRRGTQRSTNDFNRGMMRAIIRTPLYITLHLVLTGIGES
jgi:hypothetical protein